MNLQDKTQQLISILLHQINDTLRNFSNGISISQNSKINSNLSNSKRRQIVKSIGVNYLFTAKQVYAIQANFLMRSPLLGVFFYFTNSTYNVCIDKRTKFRISKIHVQSPKSALCSRVCQNRSSLPF